MNQKCQNSTKKDDLPPEMLINVNQEALHETAADNHMPSSIKSNRVRVQPNPIEPLSTGSSINWRDHKGSRIMRGKRRRRCGKNEVYRRNFDGCEATCEEPHLICPDIGYNDEVAGCACKEGYLRNKDDKCVPEECANEFQGESSEENSSWGKKRVCGRNEIFRYCFDGCEPTCEEPERRCSQVCRFVGCACKKPYLRNENGECVPRNVCTSYRS
ncbi:trypsin Inhibitor like cysteine rich domain protein [Ancylostoma ceylanicum]|uniref:Trypsin Inhibitor like cysteine rich domain protein n=1 Tax=Ancylostoma ceylanicum TaxID=53326 RepID=A0A0D6LJU5_9BILA|nr:trypsin Inhibitor like cysteine rich domain protein [Ancylostoma ceylanicum]